MWHAVRIKISQDNISISLKVVVPRELNRVPAQLCPDFILPYMVYVYY